MTRSAEKPRQASDLSSSLVMGPVVSCDPTVVIAGSQYWPGTTPSDAARLAHHLLGQGVALGDALGLVGKAEGVSDGGVPAQSHAGPRRQPPADDKGDPAARPDLVEEDRRLETEGGDNLVRAVPGNPALVGVDVDDVAGVHAGDVHLEGEGAGVLHGVEEDGRDLSADADAAGLDVGHVRDVLPHEPEEGVCGALAAGSGPHHVSHVGQGVPLLLQLGELGEGADLAILDGGDSVPGVLVHGHGVEGDVRSGPGVLGRAEVVSVGLAGALEDGDGDLVGHHGSGQVPLGVGPRLQDGRGSLVAPLV